VPVVLICAGLWAVVSQAADKSSSHRAALESITAKDLAYYVDYLADENLEGREAGGRGGRAAGDYLAEQLAKLPLEGAGTDGGFFQPFGANFRNVLALLGGGDTQLGGQVIVLGAHYDHVGYGNWRNSRGPVGHIHPGADDNASGSSAVLKLAQAFTLLSEHPKRSVLFVLFDAEEKGLLGSQYWTAHPTVPRDRVAAMLNLDMIGRLRDQRVSVYGSRSGCGMRRLLSQQNDPFGLLLDFSWTLAFDGDHYPFFERGIPVLMFHTGLHDEYHSPRDVASLIDSEGLSHVVRLVFAVAYELADRPAIPALRGNADRETEQSRKALGRRVPKLPDRLGVSWQPEAGPTEGVRLLRVFPGSPAEKAHLQPSDRIVRFAGRDIRCDSDLIGAVRGAENPALAVVRRPDQHEPLELSVQLEGSPLRLGITWRTDEAEPGAVILTYVVPGSPAAEAGLQIGDRIYQVAGEDFADETRFVKLVKSRLDTVELLVERDGRQRIVILQLAAERLRRAA
jgi:hypothetical protein